MNKIINFVIALCIVLSPSVANPPEEESVLAELKNLSVSLDRGSLLTETCSILNVENPDACTYFDKIINMLDTASFYVANIKDIIAERTSAFEAGLSLDEERNQKCREMFGEWVQKGQDLINKYSQCHEGRFELAAEYQKNILDGVSFFSRLRQLRADDTSQKFMDVDESDPTFVSLCGSKFLNDWKNAIEVGRSIAKSYVGSAEKLKTLMNEVEKDNTCPHSRYLLPEGLSPFLSEGESIVGTTIYEGGCSPEQW